MLSTYVYIYVTHQMRNNPFRFGVTSTRMLMGTNQKAQQSCGRGTDRERGALPGLVGIPKSPVGHGAID